jgi:polyribonucleotide nucleotidyltransferase
MRHTVQCDVGGKTLTIESGWIAGQADGSVTLRLGDTVMLITACMSDKAREGIDFFPLSVDYEERMYSVGRIPGSFFRREGRPSTEGILAGRLTDRPIRPLFPKGFRNEVQVVATILSADQENPPDVLSIVGASAALSISSIPFDGPIAGCRIGYVDGQMVVNPTFEQMESSTMELIVAGSKDAVVMVEAGAKEISESIILDAIEAAQEVNGKIVDAIEELVKLAGKPKITIEPPPTPREAAVAAMNDDVRSRVREAVFAGYEKGERDKAVGVIQSEVAATLPEDVPSGEVRDAFDSLVDEVFRKGVLKENVRADGRQRNEVRPITTEVGVLPRTHGTGLFTRGQTQVLSVVTLGSLSDEQRLDTLSPVSTKRYMHHYNFPPYSVGEVKRVGTPGRREIGHGALAERALEPMIPDKDDFPYTIRIVSEALSSNGSTSMGSVCGSTLSLMDAGVPIKAPVAGVAMGLIMDAEGDYAVLTDIQGIEDHLGDMDFKVAGTAEGITALQMDIKIKGITPAIMREAMAQAKEARLFILDKILSTISTHRENMSPFAPRMIKINIPVDKIGAIIGPGGKTIRAIIAETKATIDVQDDGTVFIGSPNEDSLASARSKIEGLTKEAEVGTIFKGKVVRSTNFGAFVEILPGKDGLVRLGELAEEPVQRVEDAVNVGDEVSVMVIEVDRLGRINLSRRAVLAGLTPEEALATAPPSGDGDRGGRPNFGDRRPNFQRGPGGPPRRN